MDGLRDREEERLGDGPRDREEERLGDGPRDLDLCQTIKRLHNKLEGSQRKLQTSAYMIFRYLQS